VKARWEEERRRRAGGAKKIRVLMALYDKDRINFMLSGLRLYGEGAFPLRKSDPGSFYRYGRKRLWPTGYRTNKKGEEIFRLRRVSDRDFL